MVPKSFLIHSAENRVKVRVGTLRAALAYIVAFIYSVVLTWSKPRSGTVAHRLKANDYYAVCDSLCISSVKILLREMPAGETTG